MPGDILNKAVKSVFESEKAFCKFLSANDTGATGAHQVGILVSKSAVSILFDQSLKEESILKRTVEIKWQNGLTTQSCFTYYKSKNDPVWKEFSVSESGSDGRSVCVYQTKQRRLQQLFS